MVVQQHIYGLNSMVRNII